MEVGNPTFIGDDEAEGGSEGWSSLSLLPPPSPCFTAAPDRRAVSLGLISSHQQGVQVTYLSPQNFTAAFVRQPIYISESRSGESCPPCIYSGGGGINVPVPKGWGCGCHQAAAPEELTPPLVVCDMFHLFPLQTTPVPTRPSATTSRVPTTLPPRIPRTSHTLRSSPRAGPMATHTTAPSATMHPHPRRTPADCGSGMLSIDCGSGTLTSTVDFSWGSPWLGRSWAHPPFPPLPHPFVPACSWGFVTLLINFDAVVKGQDSRLGALSNKVIHIGMYRYV